MIIAALIVAAYLIVGAITFRVTLPYRWRRAYAEWPKLEPTTYIYTGATNQRDIQSHDRYRREHVNTSSTGTVLAWPVWIPLALARQATDKADPNPLADWEIEAMQDRIAELEASLAGDDQ